MLSTGNYVHLCIIHKIIEVTKLKVKKKRDNLIKTNLPW